MRDEHHHHLVLENSYVRAYFVEIPGHESTLLHRHDFPYLNVPPGGADIATSVSTGPDVGPPADGSRVSYTLGGFSHAVTNRGGVPLRNIAIELIRPQGTIRNRCREAVKDQPKENCDMAFASDSRRPRHYALFETDEVLVEYWELSPHSSSGPLANHLDILVAALTDISARVGSATDSANAPHGILWLPADSHAIFKTAATGGHFVAITFKDSGLSAANRSDSQP
jgi:hypothetical protein